MTGGADRGGKAIFTEQGKQADDEERREQELQYTEEARGRRRLVKKERYWRESTALYLMYFGVRHKICDIYDPKRNKVNPLAEQIQAANALMNDPDFVALWQKQGYPFALEKPASPGGDERREQSRERQKEQQQGPDKEEFKDVKSYKEALRYLGLEAEGLTLAKLKDRVRKFRSKFTSDRPEEGSDVIMQQINMSFEIIKRHHGWR